MISDWKRQCGVEMEARRKRRNESQQSKVKEKKAEEARREL